MNLNEYHAKFPGGCRWRTTGQGVEVEGAGIVAYDGAQYKRAAALGGRYTQQYAAASREFGVPVELLLACSLTESAPENPETCIRKEPGYLSDEATPDRISAGFCQLLISTAREVLKDSSIDRAWLLQVDNSLRACAALIRRNHDRRGTGWDPVYVACAYNAGGVYRNDGADNRWKLRQFPLGSSRHADRFCAYFAASRQLVDKGLLNGHDFIDFESVRSSPV